MTVKDHTGQRFGRLTVTARAGTDIAGNALWDCRCDCGRTTRVPGYCLRQGRIRSCGCLGKETRSRNATEYHRKKGYVYYTVGDERLTAKELSERTGVPLGSIYSWHSRGVDVIEHLKKKGLL